MALAVWWSYADMKLHGSYILNNKREVYHTFLVFYDLRTTIRKNNIGGWGIVAVSAELGGGGGGIWP